MTPNYALIPRFTLETLQAWTKTGRPLGSGSFCEALISNDLHEAFARADEDNLRAMFHTVAWLYNYAPMNCWGSVGCLRTWPALLAKARLTLPIEPMRGEDWKVAVERAEIGGDTPTVT